jgi:hypothetical protein
MKKVNVQKMLQEGRVNAKKAKAARVIADLIVAARGVPDGNLLGALLGIEGYPTNKDAILAWARRYVEMHPVPDTLDVHDVLAAYDAEISERLEELFPF